MKHLVIITSEQFGYHVDAYYYCKYLKDEFEITYIGWDHGMPSIAIDGVTVKSVSRRGGLFRLLRLLMVIKNVTTNKETIVFIKYFKIISLLTRLMRRANPMILDIRTGSINESKVKRKLEDFIMKSEAMFFNNVSVISISLREKLGLMGKAILIPVGADVISSSNKQFDSMDILYVGTLYNRNLGKMLEGIAMFYFEYKEAIPMSFTIIGDGISNELVLMQEKAESLGVSDVVTFTGRISHDELKPWFDGCNIGMSYVPMTSYYDVQPPTKIFEYLLSGMPVLATATSENKLLINNDNGVLIGQEPNEVRDGLVHLLKIRSMYVSSQIREKC